MIFDIKIGKVYHTKNGKCKVVLFYFDREQRTAYGSYSLLNEEVWKVSKWTLSGHNISPDLDLVDNKPEPIKHSDTYYFNIYSDWVDGFNSRQKANAYAIASATKGKRIACIKRTIEYVEGEGL